MTPSRPTPGPPLTARGTLRWAVVEPLLAELGPRSVLEFGCGQGGAGARIARHAAYTGVEPDAASYEVALARIAPLGGRVLHGDAGVLPWGTQYDLICSFEVLEHLEDDQAALRAWTAHLRPGGHVVVSVPEGPERFGPSDEQVGHLRRYTRESLGELLDSAGLEVERIRLYGWPLGAALEAASNRAAARAGFSAGSTASAAERTAGSGRLRQPRGLAARALRIGARPFATVSRMSTERGIGLIGVARLP
jgi:SAM-dependent methyltransferase